MNAFKENYLLNLLNSGGNLKEKWDLMFFFLWLSYLLENFFDSY